MAVARCEDLEARSDFDLLDGWREGDRDAGSMLLVRHFDTLLRFFHDKVGHDDVEDLIQRTLLACVEGHTRFGKRASFRTWLLSVARNVLYVHYRKRRITEEVDLAGCTIADLARSPISEAIAGQQRHLLSLALRRLSAEQRLVIELHYWEGLDAAALARVFEVDPTTIRTRLLRARRQLRKTLDRLERSGRARRTVLERAST